MTSGMQTIALTDKGFDEAVVVVGKVNVDEQPALAGRFGVRSIPTLIFFKHGEAVDTVVGVVPKEEIAKRIEALRN